MEGMFGVTCITALYLDKNPQTVLKNKIGNFYEEYLQKYYGWSQVKDDETLNIAGRSRQIGSKIQVRTKTVSPPVFNIASDKDPSIT